MSTATVASPGDAFRPPPDHPDRRVAAHEVHARPPEALAAPFCATYLAVIVDPADRERERRHVADLCARSGATPPAADDIHFNAVLGDLRLKWERHTEFSAFTFVVPGPPPSSSPAPAVPSGWIEAIPGRTIVAVRAEVSVVGDADVPASRIAASFGDHEVVGSSIGDGAGTAFTDFRIAADGQVRLVVEDHGLTPRQTGRMLQWLLEIEAYRVMALLGLPLARTLLPRIGAIERSLGALTAAIAVQSGSDETLLAELTQLSADVEQMRNGSAMRLTASAAYHELVRTRIDELRERRIDGYQTIGEFMTRRLTPAMATCLTASRRMADLSARVAHASALLSTRVEIVRERQNQALLESMDRRARAQHRLQSTVEWLSIAAVTYYAAALVGYAAKAVKATGRPVDVDLAVGVSIPLIAAFVALALYRARRLAAHRPLRRDGKTTPRSDDASA